MSLVSEVMVSRVAVVGCWCIEVNGITCCSGCILSRVGVGVVEVPKHSRMLFAPVVLCLLTVPCALCAVRRDAAGGRRGPGAGGPYDDADMMSAFRPDPNADLMDSEGMIHPLILFDREPCTIIAINVVAAAL